MILNRLARTVALTGLVSVITACSMFGNSKVAQAPNPVDNQDLRAKQTSGGTSVWDLFNNDANPNTTVEVNKYLWQASLDVLNFLPVESVDPFTGVISTGYGTPPGGGRSYRATIYVQDPALDARSLKVALQSRGGGAVPVETQRAVEDAILTRARQLRIQDSKL
ncbi:MAG: DUF3576 domain-containing protein [Cereibacter sphaeroides]|uniref:DUF3576 domain-containing protein n=1 Tax=Cereibacter sphaeroides TaxID=1063 RepID=A0A2W5S337_CERSP|nr:MAG: DUF3576 domain-containing protein [Cereibacter sphaeroides]